MLKFTEFINESRIKDLEQKLKETSDSDMRDVILRQIESAKLGKK